jgi:ABC-type antimicrobial peptide transport system permease subunit
MIVFGALAMALGIVGLGGVIAHAVSQRTREIGVRVALGARHGQVLRLILGQGIRLIVVGLAVGLVGARALSRLIAALLFGVSATDTASYLSATVLWFAVALLACYIPARRALKIDPVVALRTE